MPPFAASAPPARRTRAKQAVLSRLPLTGLAAILVFSISFLPVEILRQLPATGGDTGSHYWPLHTLFHVGFGRGEFPVWNPGNNGGELQLVHYFPIPFALMAIAGLMLPLGLAFNLGAIAPVVLLPVCIYLGTRHYGYRRPTPLLAAAMSLPFLYNEANSMWGGNTLSTLAGQFAHGYALCFFMLAIGRLGFELRTRTSAAGSSMLFALTIGSHLYIGIAVPLFLATTALWYPRRSRTERARHCARAGALTLLLAAGYLVPMLSNQPWTTPLAMTWTSEHLLAEVAPRVLLPVLALALTGLAVSWRRRSSGAGYRAGIRGSLPWLCGAAFYTVCYFVFPLLGLVDIRAIPQIQLFICLVAAIQIGVALRATRTKHRWGRDVAALATLAVSMVWTASFVQKYPVWSEWNFSGWEAKDPYPELQALYGALRGSFNDGRVVFEHSPMNESAGTVRVFEMLPYFSGRATLESLYTQSTILAGAIYLLQSDLSLHPSCPFRTHPCHPQNLVTAIARMRLLGVTQAILIEPETIQKAVNASALALRGSFGKWKLYDVNLTSESPYVSVLERAPAIVTADWKKMFLEWFARYDGSETFLTAAAYAPSWMEGEEPPAASLFAAEGECHPSVSVDFNRIALKTDCPGKAHVLRFAFHPGWKASSGEELFLLSPGFIGVVPKGETVELTPATSALWRVSQLVTVVAFVWACFVCCLSGGARPRVSK